MPDQTPEQPSGPMSITPAAASADAPTTSPANAPAPTTLRIPRQGRLAVVGAVAAAIALIPATQAVASGFAVPDAHKPKPPRASSSARALPEASHTAKPRPACSLTSAPIKNARFDSKTWWPFATALHGADVVETKDGGIQNVTYERGTVQAVTATSVTILSKDSFSATWTLSATTKVWVRNQLCTLADLKPGQYVGAWGGGTAASPSAKFVVVKSQAATPVAPPAAPLSTPTATPTSSAAAGA